MSNLAKLEIVALDAAGKNYMTWASDAKLHLRKDGLLETIDPSETTPDEKKAKAMVFLRHHIHNDLKNEYITKEDPADLWQSLKTRFDHQKYVILPRARYDWLHLRFLDYKSVEEYNSAIFGITSRMELCGEKVSDYDMIEKTLSTFHPGNVVLQQQYRANGYTRFSELMQILLVAEQNNELVMLNHQTRPPGSAPFPEANVVASGNQDNSQRRGRGRGRGRSRGRGQGRGRGKGRGRGFNTGRNNNLQINEGSRAIQKPTKSVCYRCGLEGHWERACRTPKHFVDLYQASQKTSVNNVETNFINDEAGPSFNGLSDDAHLDVADFLVDPEDINGKQND